MLEIDGIASGGFTRVKGLSREMKHESYREGGVNEYEHKLITQVSYPVLVLERGLALDDFWKWAQAAADGDVHAQDRFGSACRTKPTRSLGAGRSKARFRSSGRRRISTRRRRRS